MSVRFEVALGVVRELEARSLFRFARDATDVVEGYAAAAERHPDAAALDPAYFTRLREMTCLAAAEFALLPGFADPGAITYPTPEPIPVSAEVMRLAVVKNDCNLILGCPSHRSSALMAVDLSVFSADVSRAGLLLKSWEQLEEGPSALRQLVEDIEAVHYNSGSALAQQLADSGLLRLQGLLWQVRFALVGHPGFPGTVDQAIRDFEERASPT